ncbi:MAG: hypothetical protein JXB32_11660 [Deltaproteobacteria bacterium]|nr:hypothetical protein [Deltaproteobacteria bacterium]
MHVGLLLAAALCSSSCGGKAPEPLVPSPPEDREGLPDDGDGRPDRDNDGDTIPEVEDRCPDEPEDPDGFEDDDGCPDGHNDGDRIPDEVDDCPNEPETYNACQDDDGCPDSSASCCPRVPFVPPIVEWVEFSEGTVSPQSDEPLDVVADQLVNDLGPAVGQAAVVACTLREEADGVDLAERRARLVAEELEERGVDGLRLESHGTADCETLWNLRGLPSERPYGPPAVPFARILVIRVCEPDGTGCMDVLRWDGATLQVVPHYCI